ncbi:hypothetical protein Tco_0191351 [Tanacetum coccineum]
MGEFGNGYQERDKNEDKIGQNQARDWKEREITSPTVLSDFIGPARNPLNGPGSPLLYKPIKSPTNKYESKVGDTTVTSCDVQQKLIPKIACDLALEIEGRMTKRHMAGAFYISNSISTCKVIYDPTDEMPACK